MKPTIKKLLLPFCMLASSLLGQAQSLDDEFGIFSGKEMEIKECPFDKEADAVILYDLGRSLYNEDYNYITERRIKFKILKESGLERGNIRIRYYSADDFEFISEIKAVVLSRNGQGAYVTTSLQPKNIYRKKLNNVLSEVSFALPNISVGSIVEYQYKSTMKHYGGLRDWYFQTDVPTIYSAYTLQIMPNAVFNYSVYASPGLKVDVKPDNRNGMVHFAMKEVAGLRDEAYMASEKNYLQRVTFQLSGYNTGFGKKSYTTTWPQLAGELMEHKMFGGQLTKALPGSEVLKASWAGMAPYERLKSIYDYVRTHMEWISVYSLYSENGIREAWEKKRGYSGDLNLILINLLKGAGLEVYPLLVSERHHGKIDKSYPYQDQFNKVVAYVLLDGSEYVLDATDPKTPAHLIPFRVLNTTAFKVDKKNPGFVTITSKNRKNATITELVGTLNKDGVVEAQVVTTLLDYGRIGKAESYKAGRAQFEQELVKPYSQVRLDSLSVSGLDSDSIPLQQKFKASYSINQSGDYYLLNCNYFTGFDKNPFLSDNRFTNIDFGTTYLNTIRQVFTLPPGMEVESLPKGLKLVTPDRSMAFLRDVVKKDNQVEVSMQIQLNQSEYPAQEYDMIKGFYKQLFEKLNEPIVLKAK